MQVIGKMPQSKQNVGFSGLYELKGFHSPKATEKITNALAQKIGNAEDKLCFAYKFRDKSIALVCDDRYDSALTEVVENLAATTQGNSKKEKIELTKQQNVPSITQTTLEEFIPVVNYYWGAIKSRSNPINDIKRLIKAVSTNIAEKAGN